MQANRLSLHSTLVFGRANLLGMQAIGLSLDSALAFWRSEFAKGGMSDDKFKKEHHYGIRHSYGKEGKRVDYTPASCINVIMSNPQAVMRSPFMSVLYSRSCLWYLHDV